MKKQKYRNISMALIMFKFFVFTLPLFLIFALIFFLFPDGLNNDLSLMFLLISIIIWGIFVCILIYKDKEEHILNKIHAKICRKFSWRLRKLGRIYLYIVLGYLMVIGGICAAIDKNNSKNIENAHIFMGYLKTLPYVLGSVTVLFLFVYIFLSISKKKNVRKQINLTSYKNIKDEILYEIDLIQQYYKNQKNDLIYVETKNLFSLAQNTIKNTPISNFKNKSEPKIIAYDIILRLAIMHLNKEKGLWKIREVCIFNLGKDCVKFFENNKNYTRQDASAAIKALSKTFKGIVFGNEKDNDAVTITYDNKE